MSESTDTLQDCAGRQLAALCDVLGFGDDTASVMATFRTLTSSWGNADRSQPPRWSGFSDDCSPYEISVALGGQRPEVRIGFETQADPPSVESYWQSGLGLTRFLEEAYAQNLEPFRRVEDLFRPTDPNAYFAMWHGACFWPKSEPAFKLYLNPYAKGRAGSVRVLGEALGRLGFPHAVSSLSRMMRRGVDHFLGVGLDLSKSLGNRAKVYVRVPNATRAHVERLMTFAADGIQGDASAFAATMTGAEDVFERRPLQVCYAYLDPKSGGERPDRATLLVPPTTYAPNDAVVRSRIRAILARHGMSSDLYDRCIEAFAPGPAERERGAHGYVSFQWDKGQPRITVYFYGRAFRDRHGEVDPVHPWPSPHAGYRAA